MAKLIQIGHTVQVFNSCASRPDVCPGLVEQTTMANINGPSSLLNQSTFSCDRIHASMPEHWLAIARAVVNHTQAARVFRAAIKCRYCTRADFDVPQQHSFNKPADESVHQCTMQCT